MWISCVRNTLMTFCYWWPPWESEGRNGPDCSGHGGAAVFSMPTRSTSRWASSAAPSTTIQGASCSAMASCPVTWGWPLPNMGGLEERVAQSRTSQERDSWPTWCTQSAEPSRDILQQTRHRFIAVTHWAGGKVMKVSVHFPFWWEWGWISSRETTTPDLQRAIHAHSSEKHAHRYTVVKSQKNPAAKNQKKSS